MRDLRERIKWWLQTVWHDRYCPEPETVEVPREAVARVEMAVLDVLSDPGMEFGMMPVDRDRLVGALAELTGKPQPWIVGFVMAERSRRRRTEGILC